MDTHFESDSDPDAEVRNAIRNSALKYQRPMTNPLVTRRFTRHSVRLPAAPRTTATLPMAGCPYHCRLTRSLSYKDMIGLATRADSVSRTQGLNKG